MCEMPNAKDTSRCAGGEEGRYPHMIPPVSARCQNGRRLWKRVPVVHVTLGGRKKLRQQPRS